MTDYYFILTPMGTISQYQFTTIETLLDFYGSKLDETDTIVLGCE